MLLSGLMGEWVNQIMRAKRISEQMRRGMRDADRVNRHRGVGGMFRQGDGIEVFLVDCIKRVWVKDEHLAMVDRL